ncbi:hypothetical protein IV203_023504 [Nitzschia inconspicua]|uniref:Uncharacterized protein n=1 Tax=Nitzschia inconspicua TaxID=303405 RepID=A0A9K3KD73_9STRA|nr:hypothetical protein IV203_023504 [Nitzschia inconspicua]
MKPSSLFILAAIYCFRCWSSDSGTPWISMVNAFATPNRSNIPNNNDRLRFSSLSSSLSTSSPTTTVLNSMGDNWFDSFKNLFGGMGEDEKKISSNSFSSTGKDDKRDQDDDDDLPAGTTLLLSIPAKQLKPGGLRLFLMFYLMGMQNTPHAKAWKANQPVSSGGDDHVLEMFFHDATGMIQIELLTSENETGSEVRVLRCGSVPSTAYLMQESVIVDGILDELHKCAFDDSVAPSNRLLIPEPATAISDAREALSFG